MNRRHIGWLLPLLWACSSSGAAREIDLRDYLLLREGMSEAEVLYRIGPPDYESAVHGLHYYIVSKTWSYLPASGGSGGWLSEITFDGNGRVWKLERTRL